MKFTITYTNLGPVELIKSKLLRLARERILFYKCGTNEIVLDRYCFEHYKMPLKSICLSLLNSCKFQVTDESIVILFKTKKQDNLASLITFGNGRMQGSNILKYAFGRS